MRYYQCKCGAMQFFGSGMEPPICEKCDKCGSGYGSSPTTHQEPQPHDFSFIEKVKTDEGVKTITRCRHCLETRHEIEKSGS